jgi:tRNA (guanine37-N1)-methyltransferase
LRKRLKERLTCLSSEELEKVYSSFDIIGDIAIVKHNNLTNPKVVAQQILKIHKNIKAVFTPKTRINTDFRIRKLQLLAGENRTKTTHRESGCIFKVDVEKCYFSPRLSFEHSRIADIVTSNEIVINMFAGVGCFSIFIAKNHPQASVYSIDLNSEAIEFTKENINLNKVCANVIPLLGDSKDLIQNTLTGIADRVLMPLPEKALEYLPYSLLALKKSGGWVHYYDFQHAKGEENPVDKTKKKLTQRLNELGAKYCFTNSRVIRRTGPNWYQTVIDIKVDKFPNKF